MERIQVPISFLEICFMFRTIMNRSAFERFSSNNINKNSKRNNISSRKVSKSAQSRPMGIECLNLARSMGGNFCDFKCIFALN